MLLNQFPDLAWLQKQAQTNFADARGVDQIKLPNEGWPTVVLNVNSHKTERPNILAPFSLFLNLEGNSRVHVDGKESQLSTDSFCLVNRGQTYDLVIPENAKTFNIHFGDRLVKEVTAELSKKEDDLLNHSELDVQMPEVFNRIRWKGENLQNWTNALQEFYRNEAYDSDKEYELLADGMRHLLTTIGEDKKLKNRVSSKKKSTSEELVRRLVLSQEFIHSNLSQNISLDELSRISSLSKYHFLRSFKESFGCTPHQYKQKLKVEKSIELIKKSNLSIQEIAWQLNYQEPASFNKAFRKITGFSPSMYRDQN